MFKKCLVIDTETDGVDRNSTVLTVSGIYFTINLETRELGIERAFNYYFAQEHDVPEAAARVNHLSKQILDERSGMRYFEDYQEELRGVFYAPDRYIVGHNVSFDIDKLKYTNQLYQGGFRMSYRGILDTIKILQKYVPKSLWPRSNFGPRLSVCKEHLLYGELGLTDSEMLSYLDGISIDGYSEAEALQHSSLFDSLQTMLLLDYVVKNFGPEVLDWEAKSP